MDINSLGYFAFAAPLLLFWQQARNFVTGVFSLLVRTDEIQTDGNYLIGYLKENFKEIKFGNTLYKNNTGYILKYKSYLQCLFIFKGKYIFLYKGWLPFFVSAQGDEVKITYINIFKFEDILINFQNYYHNICLDYQQKDRYFSITEVRGTSLKRRENLLSLGRSEENKPPAAGNTGGFGSGGLRGINYRIINATPPIGYDIMSLIACEPIIEKSKYYFSQDG